MLHCEDAGLVGGTTVLVATFIGDDGAPVDPINVRMVITLPDDTTESFTIASAEMTNPKVGTYKLAYVGSQAGRHQLDADGAGANGGSESMSFSLAPSAL